MKSILDHFGSIYLIKNIYTRKIIYNVNNVINAKKILFYLDYEQV